MKTEFIHANEQTNQKFYMLPKVLFTEPELLAMSASAKIIYALMLNRTSWYATQGQTDSEGRVYITFSIAETEAVLNCSKEKAVKVLKELENTGGEGLIDRIKNGGGRQAFIFVKKIISDENNPSENTTSGCRMTSERQIGSGADDRFHEVGKANTNNNYINNTKNNNNNIYLNKKNAGTNFSVSHTDIEEWLSVCEKKTGIVN